jgi:hypothetical protein
MKKADKTDEDRNLAFVSKLKEERDKLSERLSEVDNILDLLEDFPDLDQHGKGKDKKLFSKCANVLANRVDFQLDYPCCPQATLLALPHVQSGVNQVFCNPIAIAVATAVDFGRNGYEHHVDWDERMREVGISDEAIKQTREFLESSIPKRQEEL